MTEPRIRKARPGDGPGCARVWIDIGRYYHDLDPHTFQIPSPDGLADSFEQDIADTDPSHLRLVAEAAKAEAAKAEANEAEAAEAEAHDAIAGLLVARLHQPQTRADHELLRDLARPRVFVQILAVAEPHRRGGVGTALMTAAETWARERNAATISLDTYLHSPTSVPFYERRMNYARRALVFRKELEPHS